MTDSEVYVVGRQSGSPWFGGVVRATSTNNYYFGGLTTSSIAIVKYLAGSEPFIIAGSGPPPQSDVVYAIRFRAVGSQLSLKVWRLTDTEPTDPQIVTPDSAIADGQAGIGASGNTLVEVTRFESFVP